MSEMAARLRKRLNDGHAPWPLRGNEYLVKGCVCLSFVHCGFVYVFQVEKGQGSC